MLIGSRNYTSGRRYLLERGGFPVDSLCPESVCCAACKSWAERMRQLWVAFKTARVWRTCSPFSLAVHRGGRLLAPYSKPRKVQETASLSPCFWKWSLGFGRGYGQQKGFPGGSDCKESACNSGDLGPLPRLGRSPAEGNSYPLQYSCLGNSMERGAWRTTVHWGHKASYMTEWLTLSQATKLLVFKGI